MAKTPITVRGFDISMEWNSAASADATQYTVAKVTSTEGVVDLAAATTDFPLGIVQNDAKKGGAANIRTSGISYAVAGSTSIAIGDQLTWDSSGRVVKATKAGTFTASTYKYVVAVALSVPANVGDHITVELNRRDVDL